MEGLCELVLGGCPTQKVKSPLTEFEQEIVYLEFRHSRIIPHSAMTYSV